MLGSSESKWQKTCLIDKRVIHALTEQWSFLVALKLVITSYSAESPPLRLTGRFVIDWCADLHSNEASFFILCDCLRPWESMLPLHLLWYIALHILPHICPCIALSCPISILFFILLSSKVMLWIAIIILFVGSKARRCWLLRSWVWPITAWAWVSLTCFKWGDTIKILLTIY